MIREKKASATAEHAGDVDLSGFASVYGFLVMLACLVTTPCGWTAHKGSWRPWTHLACDRFPALGISPRSPPV